MRRVRAHSDQCRDECRFRFLLPALRGWECGTCAEWDYPDFDVTIIYRNVRNETIQMAFEEAATRWESVVTGDLPSQRIPLIRKGPFTSDCKIGTLPRVVDDVLVCVRVGAIDGRRVVLARASTGYRRRHNGITVFGSMLFDEADLDWLLGSGQLKGIVLHEMGHVFGLNRVVWDKMGLINNRDPSCHYKLNSAASRAWQNVTGCGPDVAVPIENEGGSGTACSHFDEQCLRTELMTGFVSALDLPLSVITVGAMEDLGFTVNYTAADNYTNYACTSECELPTRRRLLRQRSLLDDTGYQYAVQYGKEFLKNQTMESDETARLIESEEGIEYVGDQYVSIIYLDDVGTLQHVEVTADMT
ncbi:hypothetical protein FisN_29Hh022 [Fistulifera solaris]|uniref:Leishmanolysin-like peptidase n=1 Tax=Fistulifera solaris TaxID=1519565 RepID=A0A1Z5K5U3_FISSO|nr:hypothetical protein FisN_29Hh022 [Fistulifera solaris]|eukprot:GAX21589.1 hypothetical protein FisN_29Hh022 [Fistulifera solaris]